MTALAAVPAAARDTLRAAFVMEQHLGHQTLYQNLRAAVAGDERIRPDWIEVSYTTPTRLDRLAPPGRLRGALRGRHEVRRGCEDAPRDVTFFNTQVPAVIGGRRIRRRPYVLCTDITPSQYDRMAADYGHRVDGAWATRLKDRRNRAVFRGAARTVAWSTFVRDSLTGDYGVAPDRIDVIPPGVDTDRWSPGPPSGNGPLRLLFVGGDLERKGGTELLEAFSALPEGAAELTLVTRSRVAARPGVRVADDLTPNAPELLRLYQTSDVFVLPTRAEAFGIAAVEAAAAGLPVVATRVGGLPDIVVDGETGFLIAPGDAEELHRRLAQLVADRALTRRLGEAGRRRAVTRFDARRCAERLLDVLRAAVSDAPPAKARS